MPPTDALAITPSAPLRGTVALSGAKNSALKLLAASVLATEPVTLTNMPLAALDIRTKLGMLQTLGAALAFEGEDTVTIAWPECGPAPRATSEHGTVRTALLLLGALLARNGAARVPLPGGCKLGDRCHDLHFMALGRLGARCRDEGGELAAEADALHGATITFPFRTTGGTENALLAATAAHGETVIENAHTRPEVLELVRFLRMLGADIDCPGSGRLVVRGGRPLGGGSFRCQSDSMEAITFSLAALITGGEVRIRDYPFEHLEIPDIYLRESGAGLIREGGDLMVSRPSVVTPLDIATNTYPGINSDMQPLFTVLALTATGPSRIVETRFTERFRYVEELNRMGAGIEVRQGTIFATGPRALAGARVTATDLRGGAALILAGLAAQGPTLVTNMAEVDRGYVGLDAKLRALGADVKRVAS